MPSLILFRRRWQVGGDDFVYPAIVSVSARLIFLAAAVTVYVTQHPSIRDCVRGDLLAAFLIGLVVILGSTVTLETAVGVVSGRGTITNTRPRRLLPALLYTRIVVFLVEIAGSVIGAVWVFSDWEFDSTHSCDVGIVRVVQAALILSWVLLAALAICVVVLFGGKPRRDNNQFDDYELWEKRCRLCCCCEGKDENSHVAYAGAAAVLSTIFRGLDVVPSDIVAGLVLVQIDQEQHLQEGTAFSSPGKNPGPNIDLPTDPVESRLEAVWHFFKYSLAANGWPILVQSDLACWLFRLCFAGRYCTCTQTPDYVKGDNCCLCNSTAVRAITGIEEDDFLYVSFHNQIFQSPFFVVLDHGHKCVVISIRGTLSFKDLLTDVSADAEKLDVVGHEIYAHRGIVNNSKYILGKLAELNLLRDAFQRYPDYTLVVTGHSLGAGVAAILSILLREEYPNIRTFAFAPPGGLINDAGVLYTQDFVTSVVLGEDVVPRMSVSNVEQLRDQIVYVLRSCPVPKYRIILRGLWYTCCGLPKVLPTAGEELDDMDGACCNPREPLLPAGTGRGLMDGASLRDDLYHRVEEEASGHEASRTGAEDVADGSAASGQPTLPGEGGPGGRGRGPREFMELFPPGQMIWVTRGETRASGCCRKKEYQAQWVTHRQFDHIGVKPGLIYDHLPLEIDKALAWLAERERSKLIVGPNEAPDEES